MNDVKRLLSIIHEAPLPFEKTDSQLAQEYRNWFYGVRSGMLKATEHRLHMDAGYALCNCSRSVPANTAGVCTFCNRPRQ